MIFLVILQTFIELTLKYIDDSFQKVAIVGGQQPTYRNDNGILILNIFDFLLGKIDI